MSRITPGRPFARKSAGDYIRPGRRGKRLLAAAALVAVTAMALGVLAIRATAPHRAEVEAAVPIGGPFTLVDGDGRTVTRADFLGAPMLVTFGYTHCPDVCPTTLHLMAVALDALGPDGEAISPVFITVDPERDTPEVVRDYVRHFHARLTGLTGSVEQAAAAARAWRVTARKAPLEDGDYLMDHTSLIYLMDAGGAYVAHFGHGADPAAVAARLAGHLKAETRGS